MKLYGDDAIKIIKINTIIEFLDALSQHNALDKEIVKRVKEKMSKELLQTLNLDRNVEWRLKTEILDAEIEINLEGINNERN